MRVLVHLGLNKCGSTYLQHALDAARPALALAGVRYPVQPGPPCQYGLSRYYGFGPEAQGIALQTVAQLVGEARALGCDRLILSSEYLSLAVPDAARRLATDLARAGCEAEYVLYSRDVVGWVRSLFNQYIRTVEGGRHLPDIDAFLDQALANGALDIARRHRMWLALATPGTLAHYRIDRANAPEAVLRPFSRFAGIEIPPPRDAPDNASLGPDALHRIGRLRRAPPSPERDAEIALLLAGAPAPVPAPEGYLRIGPARLARLEREIAAPYEALPWAPLTSLGTPRAA